MAQMNVKDSNPQNTQFMFVKMSKNGKPIGIIVKKRGKSQKRKSKDISQTYSGEIQEIVGIRFPDDPDDERNVYRNAKIVDNKLIMKKLSFSTE